MLIFALRVYRHVYVHMYMHRFAHTQLSLLVLGLFLNAFVYVNFLASFIIVEQSATKETTASFPMMI